MIVVTREGVPVSQPELTDEQQNQLWAVILRSFLRRNPELLNPDGQDAAGASTTPA